MIGHGMEYVVRRQSCLLNDSFNTELSSDQDHQSHLHTKQMLANEQARKGR